MRIDLLDYASVEYYRKDGGPPLFKGTHYRVFDPAGCQYQILLEEEYGFAVGKVIPGDIMFRRSCVSVAILVLLKKGV